MKTYLKTGLILFAICAVCAVLCAMVNNVTAPVIEAKAFANTKAALTAVSGGMEVGDKKDGDGGKIHFICPLTKDGKVGGYVMEIGSAGYGGEFTLIASFKTNGEVIAVKMMDNSETPGLGKKSENDWYMEKYIGKGADVPLPSSKNDLTAEQAEQVSGASLTFGGINTGLKMGSEYAKSLGGK